MLTLTIDITIFSDEVISKAVYWETNQYIVSRQLNGKTETLTFDTIMDWLKIKDGKVSVKEDKVQKYVRSLAEKYETRYMDRVFHTSLGTDVTFPAGLNEYGYTSLSHRISCPENLWSVSRSISTWAPGEIPFT